MTNFGDLTMKQFALFMLIFINASLAQAQQPSIQERMSPEQFKAAGLDKLSSAELKQLNTWFNGEKTVVVEKIVVMPVVQPKEPTDDIHSHLVGEFKGWRGHTRFTLDNAQIWEQTDNSQLFANKLMHPKVRLTHSNLSGWKLQVDGYNAWVKVKRIQ
jgi:hypothetical protein